MLERLWLLVSTVPVTPSLVHTAGDLAESDALRGYDAVHLAAGLAVGVDVFVTSDARLLVAATNRGLTATDPTAATP